MRKFTNFNKLYTFSIVAKYLSFSIAAEKLFITQAAVSQQIKSLETILKYPLFRRLNKNIALTKQGEKLLKTIDTKFSDIQDNIEKINSNDLTGVLTIDTLPSFAMKWLIPRLNRFNTLYPNINIHISTSLNLVDFNKDEVDMAIRYGHEADAKTYCIKLMDEDTFLVASPALLKKHPLTIAKDLRHHTLLYDEIDCFYEAYGVKKEVVWDHFAKVLNIDIKKNRKLTFAQAHLVLQAAVSAQGIAIARSALVENELQNNSLVRLFPDITIKSPGYHLVYPKKALNIKKIQLFSNWLLNEIV